MTIEEAIRHCRDVADRCKDGKCRLEHLQLKKWLEELKERRENDERNDLGNEFDQFCRSIDEFQKLNI